MLHKIFVVLIMSNAAISQVFAEEDNIETQLFEKASKHISLVIHNDSNKVRFSSEDYLLPKQGDLGALTNLRFRLIPGAITGNYTRFVNWMNYNSPYNQSISLPPVDEETIVITSLKEPMTISLASAQQYKANNHRYKNAPPQDISITNDIANSHLLTIIYSFDAPEKLRQLADGSLVVSKYCYSRTFTLDKTIADIQNITLFFAGFERGVDKPNLSVTINGEKRAIVSGYTQNHSRIDFSELELDTGTFAWAGELSLAFRAECQGKDEEKFTQENFIAFLKAQLTAGNMLQYNPQAESIEVAVEVLDLFEAALK